MAAIPDRFSRLAALKLTRGAALRPEKDVLRAPDQEDVLVQILGAGVARNHFGEHLAIRNWYSTPEYMEPSAVAIDLLSRTRDESIARKTLTAVEDPEKCLFLDTQTTGMAGGSGSRAFTNGLW